MNRISRMMVLALAGVAAASMAVPAKAIQADVPWPILLAQAERVVIVTIESVGEPKQMDFKPPGMDKARKGWFILYRATVKEDLRASEATTRPGAATKPAKAQTLEFLAETAPPKPPGGEEQPVLIADGPSYPTLQKDKDYLLLLNRFDKDRLFLPSYFKNYGPGDRPELKQVRPLASMAKWPWGKEVKGLQLAAMCQLSHQTADSAYVQATVAVRNNTRKTVTLRVYAADKPLAISATKDNKTVPDGYYAEQAQYPQPKFSDEFNIVKIEPGQIAFISFDGQGDYGMGFNMPLGLGTWAFHAVYRYEGSDDKTGDAKYWTGELESAPFETELVKPQ